MYTPKVSRRFNNFYCADVVFDSIIEGYRKAWIIGGTPIPFKTDAAARTLADMLASDCSNEAVTHTVFIDGISAICGSKESLHLLTSTWAKQGIFKEYDVNVKLGVTPPNQEENTTVTLHLIGGGTSIYELKHE